MREGKRSGYRGRGHRAQGRGREQGRRQKAGARRGSRGPGGGRVEGAGQRLINIFRPFNAT
jgi:hypothetical protein